MSIGTFSHRGLASQILTVPSAPADARRVPSGLKAMPRTPPAWPRSVRTSLSTITISADGKEIRLEGV